MYEMSISVREEQVLTTRRARISTSIGKPNTLPFNESVFERASKLKQDTELATDETLPTLIRLQRIVEDACNMYRTDSNRGCLSRVHMYSSRLNDDLEECMSSVPDRLRSTGLLANRYHAAKMWIYEMGLIYHFFVPRSSKAAETDASLACSNPALIANLTKCVDAIKAYFDVMLATPIGDLPYLPFEEWNRFIMAFFVLYKLSVGLPDVSDWDPQLTRQTVDLEVYLSFAIECLRASRAEEAVPDIAASGMFAVMPEILESARTSYAAKRANPGYAGHIPVHMDLGPATATNLQQSKGLPLGHPSVGRRSMCPATGYWMRQAVHTDHEETLIASIPTGSTSSDSYNPEVDNIWSGILNMGTDTIY